MLLNAKNIEEAKESVEYNPLIREVIEKMKLFSDENYVQNYEREEMLFRSNVRLWKKEGRKEANYGVAKKMLLNNKSPEEIYLYTDIPVEKLTKLKLELKEEKVIYNKNNDMLREHHNKVNNQINLNK